MEKRLLLSDEAYELAKVRARDFLKDFTGEEPDDEDVSELASRIGFFCEEIING